MSKKQFERKFRRNGEYLIVRKIKGGAVLLTGAKNMTRPKRFGWRMQGLAVIAEAVVSGDMPLYAAADWFEEHAYVWSDHGNKQVPRDWRYCINLLQQFAYQSK